MSQIRIAVTGLGNMNMQSIQNCRVMPSKQSWSLFVMWMVTNVALRWQRRAQVHMKRRNISGCWMK